MPTETTALRTGLTAAAIAGGVLAVAGTAIAVTDSPLDRPVTPAVEPATVLRLATDGPGAAARPDPAHTARTVAGPPPALDVASLVKAAALGPRATRSGQPARGSTPRCRADLADLAGLGELTPWARATVGLVSCRYGAPRFTVRADEEAEPAVDVRVGGARAERIADCVLANQKSLGVDTVQWDQQVNDGEGWQLDDRDSAERPDHLRITFTATAPTGRPVADRCR